ncbi:MAG: ABC transporter ATP-binding protein [Bacilli bacterium]|nr:ABC transporter ATP-binding protein [Bacilli bacterium]
MLKRFISYYKPHKLIFCLDMLASLFISLIGIVYPIITRKTLNTYVPERNIKMIIIGGCSLLCIYIIRMLLRFFVQYYGHVMGVKMQAQMRKELFEKIESLPYTYFDNHETGKILTRMTSDLQEVSELAHHGPENFFICGITVILSFVYLTTINVYLSLILFAVVPLMVGVSIVMRKRMKNAFMESRIAVSEINGALESSITGIRVTKAFTNDEKELEKFEIGNSAFVKARSKAYKAMGQFHASSSFITDIFNVVLIICGGIFLYKELIDFPDYSAFIVSVTVFISPLSTLIAFVEQFELGITGFKRFVEIIDEKEENENPNAKDYPIDGNIEFKDVSFAYNEEKGVLNHISFKIKKGEVIALVGPSGGGKTTICHLLPNFYQINEGQILVDDHDINDFTFKSLRGQIGIVQQDVFLFAGSMKDNILYGRLDASDEEVIEAAKKANIHDYIMSLPNGYNTMVGERGVRLSGGQKQRLSIARVFLKDPRILILDEATSALDNTTEILIQRALDELCKGRTTLVVAHRLSTIKNADRIFVIAKGRIIESGNHNELIALHGTYEKLYQAQFRTKEDVIESLEKEIE